MSIRFPSMVAVLAVAASLTAGCEELGLGSSSSGSSSSRTRSDRDRDGISDRYDRSPTRADDRLSDDEAILTRRRDSDLDRTSSRDRVRDDRDLRGLSDVPRDAVRVEEGEGQTLRYEAARDGRVYVYDEDDDRVVYTGKLYRGERFIADPDKDVLSVNGKRLGDVNLRSAHRYRVYFARD